MMEQKRIELILEATAPIAHHAETFGNTSVCMREARPRCRGSVDRRREGSPLPVAPLGGV